MLQDKMYLVIIFYGFIGPLTRDDEDIFFLVCISTILHYLIDMTLKQLTLVKEKVHMVLFQNAYAKSRAFQM